MQTSLGLSVTFLENGALRSIDAPPIRIGLNAPTPFSRPRANIYLRRRQAPGAFQALTGPDSTSRFRIGKGGYVARGTWDGLEYDCALRLSERSLTWQWIVDIENVSRSAAELDAVYVQDVGLKAVDAGLLNEAYVSQYLERRILEDPQCGAVVCCRQNMKEATGHPWLMIACATGALAASTDGIQFYGTTYRATGIPEGLLADTLGGECSGESAVVAVQARPFTLPAGGRHRIVFAGTCVPDHPLATSPDDLGRLPGLLRELGDPEPAESSADLVAPRPNLFSSCRLLPAEDLTAQELDTFFGEERRHPEEANGKLTSFFAKRSHVVLRPKELRVDRPHAHIMQAKVGLVPDEDIVSTTCFAYGVFNSHLTQGNTNFNVLLSICSSPFNLEPEAGQRIIVEVDGRLHLLGVPSAFEMGLNHCRWLYKYGDRCFQVRSWTSPKAPQVNLDFKVLAGGPVRLLLTHRFDESNGWAVVPSGEGEYLARPKADSPLAGKFPEARFRFLVHGRGVQCSARGEEALFVLDVRDASSFCMSFAGEVKSRAEVEPIADADARFASDCQEAGSFWDELSLYLSLKGPGADVAAIDEVLPWYGLNALVHYLTPHGLEQFGGAAWGTRDVSQGPMELLLCLGQYDAARRVLVTLFSNQHPDGGWPQWWMFDSYANVRADSAHADISYWCLIALCSYVKASGDLGILDELLPYFHERDAAAEKTPLREHVDRLIEMITGSFLPGTALVPFGGGDWNDSMQPASQELARRMISSWTVEMSYQAFSQCQALYEQLGDRARAEALQGLCEKIKADFNKYLVKDGVVAGYGLRRDDGSITVLLHPSDETTPIRYGILPMNRGIISELFTPEQARHHQELVEQHLKGPDGARLMDRPLEYKGGRQTLFQRAESSTFFGREIGLMYVHEHLRYAEAQARTGRADAFLEALRQAIPVAYQEVVPCGDVRQSNCYYSSSDVVFRSRYEADRLYEQVLAGKLPLKGGWRVYSSGPGIFVALIVSRLLGVRRELGNVIIDPVMPRSLNGLSASMKLLGHSTTFKYVVSEGTFSPKAVTVNGRPVEFTRERNKYREGGAVIRGEQLLAALNGLENTVEVLL